LTASLARAAAIFCCILSIARQESVEPEVWAGEGGELDNEEEEVLETDVGRNSRAESKKTSPPDVTISRG
jgi:hypothetical protein